MGSLIDVFLLGPHGEPAVGPGVLDHAADLVGEGHVPTKAVVARVDDRDVSFADLDALLDHPGAVDLVVARRVG